MRSRSVAVAIILAAACAGGAVACFFRASQLRSEGEWLLARGNAQAEEYASTFDNAAAESQLVSFEKRREVLEQAHRWQRYQMLLIMSSVAAAFASYLLYLFYRLREQLVDAQADEDDKGQYWPSDPVQGGAKK
jgi:hypothetical protein